MYHSDFLFARPSFMEGVARIFDFGNTLNEYNSSLTEEEADLVAIYKDWLAVGQDLGFSIEAWQKRHQNKGLDSEEEK